MTWSVTSKGDLLRWEGQGCIIDDWSDTSAIKGLVTGMLITRSLDALQVAPRPKGIDGLFPTIIDNVATDYHNCQNYLRAMFAPPSSTVKAPVVAEAPKDTKKDVPTPTVPAPSTPAKTAEDDDS